MRRIAIQLSEEERKTLNCFRQKGLHHARENNRAHILAALDQQVPDQQIRDVLGVSSMVIWRTRAAYHQKGLDFALRDEPRCGAPRKYAAAAAAEVSALACSPAPAGAKRWTLKLLVEAAQKRPGLAGVTQESIRQILKKNVLKPWRKSMWCVGKITAEYRERMYALLKLYEQPYNPEEPVVCMDEKSKQLLNQTRAQLPARPGRTAKEDCEYKRGGTCNIFVAVEPQGGHREIAVTARRTKVDFVAFIVGLLMGVYAKVKTLHLVMDNLNTHFASSFVQVLGAVAAAPILERIQFHYTPKHASWLNMAELEIGIMDKQCTGRRMPTQEFIAQEVLAWQQRRNSEKHKIKWKFTCQDADRKLGHHYIT